MAVVVGVSAQPDERGRGGSGGDAGERGSERFDARELPERAGEAIESGADAAAGAMERARRGMGRGVEALERQMDRFEEIHARRSAQLQRLRELAVENDRPEVLERVNALIERESERYSRQISRLRERMERTDGAPEAEAPEDPATPGEVPVEVPGEPADSGEEPNDDDS